MCFEQKEVGNLVVDEGLGTPEEGESRTNVSQDVSNGLRGAIQVSDGSNILQSLPQGPVVRWDSFLPIRSLKVLLVENDDSTRHVVSALLRNCSYEVNGVANGLQAWKILEDPNNHTDIILTEVVMPVISGVALLCKIMNHKSLKNIPVIMMSSHDSMGLVFKCLSKGAVDFLVKPIRKNELKNLWQHVWRRCHSSSGSGSESGTQSRKYVKAKNNDESDDNSCSNDEQDNGSTGVSIRDGSDHGSGIQSSRAVEGHNTPSVSPGDQLADAPDSTCAQVIHTKPETHKNGSINSTETKHCSEPDEQFEDVANSQNLETRASRKPDLQCEYQQKKSSLPLSRKRKNKLLEVDIEQKGQLDHNGPENMSSKANANYTKSQSECRIVGKSNDVSDMSHCKGNCDSGEVEALELTLKRLRGAADAGKAASDDCNVLRHSDLSAFSKYNTPSSANQAPTGNVGSSLFGSSSFVPNSGPSYNFQSNSNSTQPNQQSNESGNNNDMASTNKNIIPKAEAFGDKPESASAFKPSHTSAFQTVQNSCVFLAPKVPHGKADNEEADPDEAPLRGSYQQVQVQHHHHHHHHHHYHHHLKNTLLEDQDELSLKDMATTAQQCGSSNVFGGTFESLAGNYSVNESASGSNHGSNGQNGSSAALNPGTTNVESDNGVAGNSEDEETRVRNSGGVGPEENRAAQREAALTKFRQKRKDRCFEKRVRYQSRKKLAEQRPRIRGQFVRQIMSDPKAVEDGQVEDLKLGNDSGSSVQ